MTTQKMDRQAFIDLLEAKGCAREDWPEQELVQIENLLGSDPLACEALRQHEELEQLLQDLPCPDMSHLRLKVAQQSLPEREVSLIEAALNWLFPNSGSSLVWRPALLACLPLVFGMAMGNYFNFGISSDSLLEDWDDELAMISLADYSQNQIEI